jgi:hypothetical protein
MGLSSDPTVGMLDVRNYVRPNRKKRSWDLILKFFFSFFLKDSSEESGSLM